LARYIIHRILMLIPVLLGVIVLMFVIFYYSGLSYQVVYTLVNQNKATEQMIEDKAAELGVDRPFLVQLGDYLKNLVTKGSLGTSYTQHKPVWDLIGERFSTTFILGISACLISTLLGIPLGILAAVKQNSPFDYGATIFAVLLAALPSFWVCLMLMLIFSVKLGWTPVTGVKTWTGFILPVISTAMMPVAMNMRMTRSSMLEVIRQDYIRTARAKGVPEKTVIWKHALNNALIPVLTVVGMNVGMSLTGSVIAETIFNIPGLGLLMSKAITQRDTITVTGCVLLCAFIISFMSMLTDIVYALVDPRIKAQYTSKKKRRTSKQTEGVAA
jgi:peptide/nickel transport system permease protein